MTEFLRANGITRIDRLTDGRVACCICYDFCWPKDLSRLADGSLVDVCVTCADAERTACSYCLAMFWPSDLSSDVCAACAAVRS